jgi:uncharacterized protein YecA (UPF0149 family)
VCFDCGHCGFAAPEKQDTSKDDVTTKAGVCTNCKSDSHTNFIDLVLPNGQQIPWIERSANTSAARAPSLQPASKGRVKPNDPCPCGSKKKSKKCCYVGGG